MALLITCGVAPRWCEFAQVRLKNMGINEPMPSKRSELTISDLMDGACHSAGLSSLEQGVTEGAVPFGRTWEIATADFFIANSRSDNWGWADSRNVLFLDAWREFEPNAKFLLLYGSVSQFLANEIETKRELESGVQERVDFWIAYQRTMMDFYHRNRDVATLIHVDFLSGAADRAADAVKEKLGVELNRLNDHATLELSRVANIAASHLVSSTDGHSDVLEALENSADSPAEPPQIDDAEYAVSVLAELREISEANMALSQATERNSELERRLEQAVRELDEAKNIEASAAAHFNEEPQATNEELVAEIDVLHSQLAQTQSELTRYFSKYQDLKRSGINAPQPVVQHPDPIQPEIGSVPAAKRSPETPKMLIDFRSFVDGTGMYHPEPQGRWAGPLNRSDIQLKDLEPGHYDVTLRVIDAMSVDILYGVKLALNGRELETKIKVFSDIGGRLAPLRRLKATVQKHKRPFPVDFSCRLRPEYFNQQNLTQVFSILCPGVKSPSVDGAEDSRRLSICVRSLELSEIG